jgi:UDP-N-acetylglucosamine 2-epimerase (non-hydrolysing)
MIKVLTVFGTRPEAIKLAPVIKELEQRQDSFESRVCVTGQHRELLDQMLDLFEIRPDHDLAVMTHDQSPTDVTLAVLGGLRHVLATEEPDWVLVQGDTTTTMAGGLGAFHHGCRVAHVEAGLRTFDPRDPWPEEMNRRVAGVVSDLHFAPTAASADNLYREGVARDQVIITGNTVIDALRLVSAIPFEPSGTLLAEIPLQGKRLVIATMHRRETSRQALRELCGALIAIAGRHEDVQIVCPVHPNPNVRHPVHELLSGIPNITLVAPLDYQPMIWLLQRSHFVITDSGGLQEEATAMGKPVLVIREKTERPEGIAAGTALLVGTDQHALEAWATRLLSDPALYESMARVTDAYGDGYAARRIIDAIREQSSDDRDDPGERS